VARHAAAQRAIERRFDAFVRKLGAWMGRQRPETLAGLELWQIVERFTRHTGTPSPCDAATLKRVCGEAIERFRAQASTP